MGEQLYLWLCSFVQKFAGGTQGWVEGRAGLRFCPALAPPCWIWVCLRARQQSRPRRVSPGMLPRCLAASQFAVVRDRRCLDKLMINEQRSRDSKPWGRGEARVVTHVNLSRYSFETSILRPTGAVSLQSSVPLSPRAALLSCRAQSIPGVTLLPCHPADTATLEQGWCLARPPWME